MKDFLIMLHNDIVKRWMKSATIDFPDPIAEVMDRLNPTSCTAPHPETVGEAIGYWRLGVSIIEGREPHDPYRITPNGEIFEIIPE